MESVPPADSPVQVAHCKHDGELPCSVTRQSLDWCVACFFHPPHMAAHRIATTGPRIPPRLAARDISGHVISPFRVLALTSRLSDKAGLELFGSIEAPGNERVSRILPR